jgi:XTP/dITP diphosphohydrolase
VRRLVVASTNDGKVREIREVLFSLRDWTVEALPPGIAEPEENGLTFAANAAIKARAYSLEAGLSRCWVVADDSGLEVDALDQRPGIHSARYALTDEARNQRLLAELEGVAPDARTARYVCALAVGCDGRILWSIECQVEGAIAAAPAGTNGFGYDPLFWLPDRECTMAQVDRNVKNVISHRGQALTALRTYLQSVGVSP